MGLNASTQQLGAMKASDTKLTTKTGDRKAGRSFCIFKIPSI